MMNLEEVKVYDPKSDGIDYECFKKVWEVSEAAQDILFDFVSNKVLNSEINNSEKFKDALYGDDGLFAKEDIESVLVCAGKIQHKCEEEPDDSFLEKIAEDNNSMIFCYSGPRIMDSFIKGDGLKKPSKKTRIYDPKKNGITYTVMEAIGEINLNAHIFIKLQMIKTFLKSTIDGVPVMDFAQQYLSDHDDAAYVAFVGDKHYSLPARDGNEKRKQLAKKHDAVVFVLAGETKWDNASK